MNRPVAKRVITPPATIGMLGGGQLGRYALMAAASMGYRTIVVDPDPSAPAGVIANEHLVAAYDDPTALQRLRFDCDVVTTEFENPPAEALDRLAMDVPVAPSPRAVRIAQDRIAEKRFCDDNGFPVGPYAVLDDPAATAHADSSDALLDHVLEGGAAVVKTARLGYDGKGQHGAGSVSEVLAAWADLGGVPCVVEARLALDMEISVLVGRRPDGDVRAWPAAENRHVDGILDLSTAPVSPKLADGSSAAPVVDRAVGLAMAIADALDFVGVLGVEFFVVGGELLVNELAPRPHNSGHWTLDASPTSQFEQQIRAVCGLALGDTSQRDGGVAMVNLLGDRWVHGEPRWERVFEHPRARLHLYGKSEPRPGRKMGHLTVVADDPRTAATTALALREAITR